MSICRLPGSRAPAGGLAVSADFPPSARPTPRPLMPRSLGFTMCRGMNGAPHIHVHPELQNVTP